MSRDALRHEPKCLEKNECFSEPVTFAFILYLSLGRKANCLSLQQGYYILPWKWVFWFIGFFCLVRASKAMKSSHDNEESVCLCQSEIACGHQLSGYSVNYRSRQRTVFVFYHSCHKMLPYRPCQYVLRNEQCANEQPDLILK